MKYWNKQKEVRLRCWTKIALPAEPSNPYMDGHYQGWSFRGKYDAVKFALQQNPSQGKFYMNIMVREIWFELREDAFLFTLLGNNEKA